LEADTVNECILNVSILEVLLVFLDQLELLELPERQDQQAVEPMTSIQTMTAKDLSVSIKNCLTDIQIKLSELNLTAFQNVKIKQFAPCTLRKYRNFCYSQIFYCKNFGKLWKPV